MSKTAYISQGLWNMLNERYEQFHKHGHKIESDVLHNPNGELVAAARALIKPTPVVHDFPEHWGIASVRKMINKSYIERLTIAGALIAAEIDRFLYLEEQKKVRKGSGKETPTPHKYHPLTPDQAFKTDPE